MKNSKIRIILSLGIPLIILTVAYIFDGRLSRTAASYTDHPVHWYSLLPPLAAISVALIFRRVLTALFTGVVTGAVIKEGMHPVAILKTTVVDYIWENLSNQFSMLFVVFVFALIGMISIINRGGGSLGVVNLFSKAVRGARSASLATMAMGLVIFFDDYTNTIVVGSTMRTLTDRLKISREKLAYLVDSTTAPIAGLALISTWIGFEVEQLQHIASSIDLEISGYALFLKMLPFRFYCIFTIVFVFFIAFFRRDFGTMLSAERRATIKGEVSNPESKAVTSHEFAESHVKEGIPHRWFNAVIPVATVILSALIGVIICGTGAPIMEGKTFSIFSWSSWYGCFIGIGQVQNGIPIILASAAIIGSVVAATLFFFQKILSIKEMIHAWFHGWEIIFVIAGLLVLAWAIREVCDELGTAYYILAAIQGNIATFWLPLVIFGISSLIAFATGTSWGTMGILFPIFGPIAATSGDLHLMVISMSAILDGAIFGDHCSPISDTTILSSVSSNCDHIDHVKTQLPYALTTAFVAGIAGYIPAALGAPFLFTYIVGIALISVIIFSIGKKV